MQVSGWLTRAVRPVVAVRFLSNSPRVAPSRVKEKGDDIQGGPWRDRLANASRSTLERNWREGERHGVRFAYTAPSGERYPWQWYWDSAYRLRAAAAAFGSARDRENPRSG
jgi:hypothetical protein